MNKKTRKAKHADKLESRAFMLSLYAGAAQCVASASVEPVRALFAQRAAHCAIHSKAKDGGAGWRNVFGRFDAGKLPPIFAKGNGKLPFFAFSSLAGIDCPQAGACLYRGGDESAGPMSGFCYSFKAWRYPAAFFRQLVNSIRLRTKAGRGSIPRSLPPKAFPPPFPRLCPANTKQRPAKALSAHLVTGGGTR